MPKTYEYNKKYVKTYMAKFERIGIKVPKGKRELLKSYAEKHSESVNELINRLIDAELGGADVGGRARGARQLLRRRRQRCSAEVGPHSMQWSMTDGCRLTLPERLSRERPPSGRRAAKTGGGDEYDSAPSR